MWILIVLALCVIGGFFVFYYTHQQKLTDPTTIHNFYDLCIVDIYGDKLLFEQFRGKYVLIVNIASRCGFTAQLGSLQNLYELYHDRLCILGVPCDQFAHQTPENEADMRLFCEKHYGVEFLLSEKIAVKGAGQHPLYQWLTHKSLNGVSTSRVQRNFQKYLIDPNGQLLAVFGPQINPFDLKITAYLQT